MNSISIDPDSCPIARVTALIGEPWTLMILREAFLGRTRFKEFEGELGIARNILSDRLRKLVEAGLLSKAPHPVDRRALEYRLTDKGKALFPAIIALAQWAGQHLCDRSMPLRFVERRSGKEIAPIQVRMPDGEPVQAQDLVLQFTEMLKTGSG